MWSFTLTVHWFGACAPGNVLVWWEGSRGSAGRILQVAEGRRTLFDHCPVNNKVGLSHQPMEEIEDNFSISMYLFKHCCEFILFYTIFKLITILNLLTGNIWQ